MNLDMSVFAENMSALTLELSAIKKADFFVNFAL
jgi:hypothetical protein